MAKRIFVALALSVIGAFAAHSAARPGDFSLLDHNGYFHQLSYYDDRRAVALLVYGIGDAATAQAAPAFVAARARYADRVKFFLLNPHHTATRASVQQDLKRLDIDAEVLMDDTQLVSEALGVDETGEVLLVSPSTSEVLYRGPTGKHFEHALEQVIAGKPVQRTRIRTNGTKVTYAAAKDHKAKPVSYSKDVAPILAENCARCHRDGGVAPFAMNSHAVVKGFAPMIREVVLTRRMPPGQIDPHVGKFKETYTLTPHETQQLVHWIEAGAEKDGEVDPLTQLTWPASKWAHGEPDLIIKLPPQKIPATGILDYIPAVVPIEGMDRDRFVRASQFVAGDRTVLHHTLVAVIPPGAKANARFLGVDPNLARISAYIPGAEPQIEPPNTGGLLKKGSSIELELHYMTSGRETVDRSEIGVWFYPDDQPPTERMTFDCACRYAQGWEPIPAYDPDHEMKQTITIPKDAHIYSMLPHMHFRGKRLRFYAEYPNGTTEALLNIAKYNYSWQLYYQLAEPKFVPGGTKITVVAAYDNSTQNKANPDPSRSVPWGLQSWDEMFVGVVNYKFVDQSGA
ncbi:MAG TPA: hypothetical protein VGK58_20495, partial [Lacipirellulaceae bacterium]